MHSTGRAGWECPPCELVLPAREGTMPAPTGGGNQQFYPAVMPMNDINEQHGMTYWVAPAAFNFTLSANAEAECP